MYLSFHAENANGHSPLFFKTFDFFARAVNGADVHVLIAKNDICALAGGEGAAVIIDAHHFRRGLCSADECILKADAREFCEIFDGGEHIQHTADDDALGRRALAVIQREADAIHLIVAVGKPRGGEGVGDENEFIALMLLGVICHGDDLGGYVDAVADKFRVSIRGERCTCSTRLTVVDRGHGIEGMGEGDSWILNGSMADKSMLRNYLPYRIASEIGGGMAAPDSRYCEVLLEKEDGTYRYQGVYLLMETVSRGKNRVNIDQFKKKKSYTSYIVRRDRFTNFDVMLDTYGRLNGFSEEWIGVKYPSEERITEEAKAFIEQDFSKIEQVMYAEDESVFKAYDRYIDIDSFVDYFLINEFFGNYDAGNHSTYMYKNSGGKLYIGSVWDFDQAMNNYFEEEMDPYTLAFQTKPFYEQLTKDKRFLDCLKKRYSELRKGALSEEHVFAVMDEAVDYLVSAREREWYRWAADYKDGSFDNPHNYYLQDYEKDDVVISRFNDDYEQELYVIRTYLHKHGNVIQTELTKLYDSAEYNTSINNENELLLLIIMMLFLVPSFLINRR